MNQVIEKPIAEESIIDGDQEHDPFGTRKEVVDPVNPDGTQPMLTFQKVKVCCTIYRRDQFGGMWDRHEMEPENAQAEAYIKRWGKQG